jgi:hypothetical protein
VVLVKEQIHEYVDADGLCFATQGCQIRPSPCSISGPPERVMNYAVRKPAIGNEGRWTVHQNGLAAARQCRGRLRETHDEIWVMTEVVLRIVVKERDHGHVYPSRSTKSPNMVRNAAM